ncbi:hypothetical protein TI05_12055 [Achromatium sp. WMS3]|nr:hypothetical protein TI05_12055 [Achromatium sp. WMS3]
MRQNYKTDLYNILKDREIFLVDLRQNSPKLNGKEVKVLLADICFDVAHYYSGKGYKAAHQTVGEMGRLGAPQFIFINRHPSFASKSTLYGSFPRRAWER